MCGICLINKCEKSAIKYNCLYISMWRNLRMGEIFCIRIVYMSSCTWVHEFILNEQTARKFHNLMYWFEAKFGWLLSVIRSVICIISVLGPKIPNKLTVFSNGCETILTSLHHHKVRYTVTYTCICIWVCRFAGMCTHQSLCNLMGQLTFHLQLPV